MKRVGLLRRYWLEAGSVIAFALPWAAAVVLGFLWLWQEQALIWWCVAAALLGSPFFLLRCRKSQVRSAEAGGPLILDLQASPEWTLKQKDAWKVVQEIASTTAPFSFVETKPIEVALQRTVATVADYYHPNSPHALWQITLPEALLLVERTSSSLRSVVLQYFPGSQHIPISHGVWLKERYDINRRIIRLFFEGAKRAYHFYRIVHFVHNPGNALAKELNKFVTGGLSENLSTTARIHLTQAIIQEVGRAAIDLYSGSLRLSATELRAMGLAEAAKAEADMVGPIRILLAGQVNAGKSSLLNAMAGEVQCATAPVPTTTKAVEYRLEVEGKPQVILVDMPGITHSGGSGGALFTEAERADMILWIASATQPARAPDSYALQQLRAYFDRKLEVKAPPILGVVTHIDQLSPASEWSPPYDLIQPERAKARMIRDAVESVAEVLALAPDVVVPVAVREAKTGYNLDLLWARIADNLDHARSAKAARLLMAAKKLSVGEICSQAYASGRWIAEKVWASTFPKRSQEEPHPESTAAG